MPKPGTWQPVQPHVHNAFANSHHHGITDRHNPHHHTPYTLPHVLPTSLPVASSWNKVLPHPHSHPMPPLGTTTTTSIYGKNTTPTHITTTKKITKTTEKDTISLTSMLIDGPLPTTMELPSPSIHNHPLTQPTDLSQPR